MMMGVLKAKWRRRDSLCLSSKRLSTRNNCTIRSSLRALGVREVCTRKWRWEPSLPTKVSLRWLLPWRRTIGTSAPILSSFTVWSGATSCKTNPMCFSLSKSCSSCEGFRLLEILDSPKQTCKHYNCMFSSRVLTTVVFKTSDLPELGARRDLHQLWVL